MEIKIMRQSPSSCDHRPFSSPLYTCFRSFFLPFEFAFLLFSRIVEARGFYCAKAEIFYKISRWKHTWGQTNPVERFLLRQKEFLKTRFHVQYFPFILKTTIKVKRSIRQTREAVYVFCQLRGGKKMDFLLLFCVSDTARQCFRLSFNPQRFIITE